MLFVVFCFVLKFGVNNVFMSVCFLLWPCLPSATVMRLAADKAILEKAAHAALQAKEAATKLGGIHAQVWGPVLGDFFPFFYFHK